MKCKKTIILLVLVVFLLGIACVSASEIDNTIASGDTDSIELSADNVDDNLQNDEKNSKLTLTDNDDTLSVKNDTEIIGDNTGTYSGLSTEIGSGGNIELQHDYYTYDSGNTIAITVADSVIDGKGAVIDMDGSNIRAFDVSASGVTFKNLTIKNVYYKGEEFGGAIYFNQSGTVTNCNFTDNIATIGGGAVWMRSGTVSNCNFVDNRLTNEAGQGGAIYIGSGNVSNCSFTHNEAIHGGAVWISSGTVSNCIFDNNIASIEGGAVWLSYGSVKNCYFVDNYATGGNGRGAAVYIFFNGSVENCNFTGNNAHKEGGAVFFINTGKVTNCIFTGNTAFYQGGSVWMDSGSVENCNFTDNTASQCGNAVYFNKGEVRNCNFINCTVTGDGGAVFFHDEGKVINCNFTNNVASQNGGAVYIMGTGNVTNCIFTDNTASGNGGAVWISSGTVFNCSFNHNTANDGGVVHMGSGTVSNCNFTDNAATGDAAVYMNSGSVENCNFVDNTASGNGGAVHMGSGTVLNCNFVNNTAIIDGGAIYFTSTGTVTNCNFAGNKANGDDNGEGGAVNFEAYGTVTNCNFTDNTGVKCGAVYFYNGGKVTNCKFTNNSASRGGGAIDFEGNGQATVTNCNFTDNTGLYGGGVYIWNSGSVTDCNFINNCAGNGGAVHMGGGAVTNCNFTENSATNDGGAVYFDRDGEVTICNFVNNSASRGGAILSDQGIECTVDTCIFKTDSDTTVNTRNLPPVLKVENFTTFYGSDEKLTFDLKTNGNISLTNGNISISVYSKGNNFWIGNYSCLSGEGWIPDLLVGSYYAIFNTEYAGFQPINRTITITLPDGKCYVNVTSLTTNNKTVNITAKSNIPNDVVKGKLLFILPDGIQIEATYGVNGTWWAIHTFDDYGDYKVNATYVGLDNVTITNATISISKTLTEITIENANIELFAGDSVGTGAALTPAGAGSLSFTSSNITVVKVEDGKIIALKEGSAIITVSFAGSDDYAAAGNKTISVTVNLNDASVSVNNSTLDLLVGDSFGIVATTNPGGLNVTFVSDNSGVYSIDENGVVTALKEGIGSLTVKVGGDGVYAENSTVVSVTVSKIPTEITVENATVKLFVGDSVAVGATLKPANAGNVTYTVSNSSVVKVEDGKIVALKEGSAVITVSFAGDDKYVAAENKTISVTVNLNDASVSVNNSTLDLLVGDEFVIAVTTNPGGLNVTFVSDNSGVYSIDENGVVTALKGGIGSLTVKVGGDGVYAENSTVVSVTVGKIPTEITVENETVELSVGDSVAAGARLKPAHAGNVTYTVSNFSVVKVEDGNIMAVGKGSAVITVSFAGDERFAAAENKTITVSVKDWSKVIISPIADVVYPNNVVIKYSIENRTNVSVSIGGVSDDKIIITNDTITVIGLGASEYTITIINNESDMYHDSSDTKTFTVKKQATSIAAASVTATYNKNKVVVITLKDSKGKVLANAKVTVVLGKTRTYTTDKNGQIKVSTKGLAPKKYTAKITFNGNTNYAKSTKDVKVTVKKATPKITAKKKTFKRSVKVKKYSVVLKNNVGKAIKKTKVTIKIAKKTFTAKTNSKGKATFKIKKVTKKGTYKAKVTYKGNVYYNKVTKKVKIKLK